MLYLENIQLGYGRGRKATSVYMPFSARAEKAQMTALIGRNGKGKSTLLRCIAGLQRVIGGSIFIDNTDINQITCKRRAALISYVSTDNLKVGNLKAFDLVALGRYPYLGITGKLNGSDKTMVEHSLQQVGMLWAAYRDVCHLSDGERQRLIIARALAQDTPIVVLDEPTAFLDVPNSYEIISLLKDIAVSNAKIVIFSTHNISLSLCIAHQIWLMGSDNFYAASPETLIKQKMIKKEFLG